MEAYTESADAMIAAFREPGALGRMVTMPFGEFPAAGLAAFRFTDLLAHAWDLAEATDQDSDLRPDLCESALAMSRERLDGRDRATSPSRTRCSFLALPPPPAWPATSANR